MRRSTGALTKLADSIQDARDVRDKLEGAREARACAVSGGRPEG